MAGLLTDALTTALILLPGFFSLRVTAYIAHYQLDRLSDLQVTIQSLFMSLVVALPTTFFLNVNSITDADKFFQPLALAVIIGSALGIGGVSGVILRYTLHARTSGGSPWDGEARDNVGNYASVVTSDGEYYMGWIHRMSGDDTEKREIVLSEPERLRFGSEGEITGSVHLTAKSVIFTEGDIKRVILDISEDEKQPTQSSNP